MRFWDASAIVPLLVNEATSEAAQTLLRDDPHMVVWWATELECASAISRRERELALDLPGASVALRRLDELAKQWDEIQPVAVVRARARRLLRVHPLRTADSLQLAAALALAGEAPGSVTVVSLDQRLSEAALREGLQVLPAIGGALDAA